MIQKAACRLACLILLVVNIFSKMCTLISIVFHTAYNGVHRQFYGFQYLLQRFVFVQFHSNFDEMGCLSITYYLLNEDQICYELSAKAFCSPVMSLELCVWLWRELSCRPPPNSQPSHPTAQSNRVRLMSPVSAHENRQKHANAEPVSYCQS